MTKLLLAGIGILALAPPSASAQTLIIDHPR